MRILISVIVFSLLRLASSQDASLGIYSETFDDVSSILQPTTTYSGAPIESVVCELSPVVILRVPFNVSTSWESGRGRSGINVQLIVNDDQVNVFRGQWTVNVPVTDEFEVVKSWFPTTEGFIESSSNDMYIVFKNPVWNNPENIQFEINLNANHDESRVLSSYFDTSRDAVLTSPITETCGTENVPMIRRDGEETEEEHFKIDSDFWDLDDFTRKPDESKQDTPEIERVDAGSESRSVLRSTISETDSIRATETTELESNWERTDQAFTPPEISYYYRWTSDFDAGITIRLYSAYVIESFVLKLAIVQGAAVEKIWGASPNQPVATVDPLNPLEVTIETSSLGSFRNLTDAAQTYDIGLNVKLGTPESSTGSRLFFDENPSVLSTLQIVEISDEDDIWMNTTYKFAELERIEVDDTSDDQN